ncbi:amidohydrolase family protein [Adhaeribacter radiodurans]|uniref:Amidohydrolase n=1 Tax=Adhaeribacter radiodurans TaxID=2745197 RepID=A0A7L7LDH9_9BACT|nr:amidohydrolase family protein [Adhaeribacter radiodurans]QMU30833.1 amidohydrolase [Adhaeribacter radiodurans]
MIRNKQFILILAGILFSFISLIAQAQEMSFEEYEPKSTLVVPEHPVTKAKYPFIDVHSHQNSNMSKEAMTKIVKEMDALNMRTMVNLSGGSGSELKSGVANLKGSYPNRFVVFANVDFSKIDDPNFGEKAATQLEQDVKNGAQGLKIFKNLGMTVKDKNGKRIPTDDPRLNPIWQKCAELKIPVLIHTGEPQSFFDPIDKNNERWLELKQFPNRARPSSEYPSWEQVMQEQHSLFAKNPKTIFINAHLGWLGGDLARLGKLLDKLPNVYTEIGAVLAELGRQPHFAREWFIKYQDRVLFGKDIYAPTEYHTYFRVLETNDEYFDYYRKRHAFWKMYGLNLPDEVLKKLYYKNALKIVPRLDATGFPK